VRPATIERREDEQQHAQRAHHDGEHRKGERNDNAVAERHVVLDRGLDGRHEGVVAHHLEAERARAVPLGQSGPSTWSCK
jgi:hypothetical protein